MTIHKHYGITIDIEAINPALFLCIGIVLSRHPGNKVLVRKKFYFRTDTFRGQDAKTFWNLQQDNFAFQQEINKLDETQQSLLKQHAGFTLLSLKFWIQHLDTLKQLMEERSAERSTERSTDRDSHGKEGHQQMEKKREEEPWEVHRAKTLQKIHQFLFQYITSYSNLVYLTDNPAYDLGFIDCMCVQEGLSSIRQNEAGEVFGLQTSLFLNRRDSWQIFSFQEKNDSNVNQLVWIKSHPQTQNT